jgi:hypothetical protein
MKRSILLLAGVASLAVAPAARADTLVTPAPGARNVAHAGGYAVWAAPGATAGTWRLVVRAPGGTVADADVAAFGAAPDPSIGSGRAPAGRPRPLLAVYSRCEGASSISGCDVYAYDLRTGTEQRVREVSSSVYSETAPSVTLGTYAFVRRGGGTRKGVYVRTARVIRRLSGVIARETANNGTRVAYTFNSSRGGGVAVRRISGRGGVLTPAVRQPSVPRSVQLSRYQAGWLVGQQAFSTTRFAGSGGPFRPRTIAGRTVPGIDSFGSARTLTELRFADAEGIKIASPPLFGPAS